MEHVKVNNFMSGRKLNKIATETTDVDVMNDITELWRPKTWRSLIDNPNTPSEILTKIWSNKNSPKGNFIENHKNYPNSKLTGYGLYSKQEQKLFNVPLEDTLFNKDGVNLETLFYIEHLDKKEIPYSYEEAIKITLENNLKSFSIDDLIRDLNNYSNSFELISLRKFCMQVFIVSVELGYIDLNDFKVKDSINLKILELYYLYKDNDAMYSLFYSN